MIDYTLEYNSLIQKASSSIGKDILPDKYEIIDLGVPHKPKGLPIGRMGIYTFSFNDRFLKIGKAGENSGPRFLSQHYNLSSNSTLAASLIRDDELCEFNISKMNVKAWIKANCRRIDIVMDSSVGVFALGFIEALLHYAYEPKYEGFISQR
jgi:hypothetical protein